MKNKYFRYVLLLVSILLVSCKKEYKKGIIWLISIGKENDVYGATCVKLLF